jgi:TetR/AcrR family transcriptional repressor of nem operon
MRRSREDAAATRQAIVRAAARLFRARGIDAVSVADVMSAQGLTVGGFYRHFADKEQLVAEAIDCAAAETLASHAESLKGLRPADVARTLVDGYLSLEHCAHPESGCPVAALCTQVVHAGPAVRSAFTRALRQLLTVAAIAVPGEGKRARQRRLQVAAALVGAVVLARATDDDGLALEMLGSVRRGFEESERRAPEAPRRTRKAHIGRKRKGKSATRR